MELQRITTDPLKMGGKPCIRGMRVTVDTVVGLIASGLSIDQVLDRYPYLEQEDIYAALSYAAWKSQEAELKLIGVDSVESYTIEHLRAEFEKGEQGPIVEDFSIEALIKELDHEKTSKTNKT